jgi:hypothetical protein
MVRRLFTACFVLLALTAAVQAQQPKRRVAVMNFDYATVTSYVQQVFGTNQDIGKGIADMLVDKLVNDGQFWPSRIFPTAIAPTPTRPPRSPASWVCSPSLLAALRNSAATIKAPGLAPARWAA